MDIISGDIEIGGNFFGSPSHSEKHYVEQEKFNKTILELNENVKKLDDKIKKLENRFNNINSKTRLDIIE